MSAQKLMIIAVVALVVVFAITIALGSTHGSSNTDRPGVVSALKGLQGNRFLTIGDKATTNCSPAPPPATLAVSSSCAIAIAKRGFLSAATRVVLVPQGGLTVITDPANGPTQQVEVESGRCFASAIDHSGGTLTLLGFTNITLLDQPCP